MSNSQEQTGITIYPEGVDSADGIRRVAGNKALYDKLLKRIASELPANLQSMQDAIAAADYDKVKILAHTLKGSSGNLAITVIYEKSLALETAAKDNDAAAIATTFADLSESAQQYVQALL